MTTPGEQETSQSLIGANRAVTTAVLVAIGLLSFTLLALIILQSGRIVRFGAETMQMARSLSPRSAKPSPATVPEPYLDPPPPATRRTAPHPIGREPSADD